VVVLDELSRHEDPVVRAWVPAAAVDLLGEDAERLVRAMARDRDPLVKEAAAAALSAEPS
jgi:HEAT repeat protein